MGVLQDYSAKLSAIRNISAENKQLQDSLSTISSRIMAAEGLKSRLQMEMRTSITQQTNAQLESKIARVKAEINSELDKVRSALASFDSIYNSNINALPGMYNTSLYSKELEIIENANQSLEKARPIVDTMGEEILAQVNAQFNSQTQQQLNMTVIDNCIRVLTTASGVGALKTSELFSKVIAFLLLDWKSLEKLSNKARMIIYGIYYTAVALFIIAEPFVAVFGYSSVLLVASAVDISDVIKSLRVLKPYKTLEAQTELLRQTIDTNVASMIAQATEVCRAETQKQRAPVLAKQTALLSRLQDAPAEVRRTTSDSELVAAVTKNYNAQMATKDEEIAACRAESARSSKCLEVNAEQLSKLLVQKDELKLEIEEQFFNLSHIGKDKMLTKTFFLGFDDTGELMEFQYGGNTTLIPYIGDNSSVNSPLISMMLMQLLSSMSIACLKIVICDTFHGGADFAVFAPSAIQDQIKLVTTTEQVKKTIESFHTELLMRNRDILAEAASIEDYNTKMLNRHSLTREYWFMFVQDPDVSVLSDQKFLQLMRTGPRSGLIPIIFTNTRWLQDCILKTGEDRKKFLDFIESTSDSIFSFDGRTNNLMYKGPRYRESLIAKLKGGF